MSALVPYKRVELAIEACRRLGARLDIVGRGPERDRLEAMPGRVSAFWAGNQTKRFGTLYQQAAAVLLPGTEDFGMVPVEAQACGTPVVALGAGGAMETVRHGVTGILAAESSVEASPPLSTSAGARRSIARRFAPTPSSSRGSAFWRSFPAVVDRAVRDRAAQLALERAS